MQPMSSNLGPPAIARPVTCAGVTISSEARAILAGPHIRVAAAERAWPLLDVSLVTYNSSKWLPQFFASLLAQGYPTARIRVLAVDHGSQDDSFERLQEFSREHGAQFAEVVVTRQPNRGFGAGHNANMRTAAADYFLVTNVDLEFEHDTLVRLVEAATASASDVASWECRQKPFEHPKNYNPATLETSWCSSACVLLRTEALRQVGGYDEKLFMYGEDVDLSYRLRDRGHRLQYCPRAVCWHYGHAPGEARATEFLGISLANLLLRLRFGGLRDRLCIPLVYLSRWWIVLYRPSFAWGLLALVPKFFWQAPAFVRSRRTSRQAFPFRGVGYEIARDRTPIAQQKVASAAQPLVSIVIRTYAGRLGFLREAVQSVLNQTYPRIELIVVEDGETRFAESFIEACTQKSSLAIRYLTTPKRGRCRSGNAGLRSAGGIRGIPRRRRLLLCRSRRDARGPAADEPNLRGGVFGRVGNCHERPLARATCVRRSHALHDLSAAVLPRDALAAKLHSDPIDFVSSPAL